MSKKNHSGKKKVLITGISGFIGSAVAEKLHGEGYQVSGLVRKSTRKSDALERLKGKVSLFEADLTDSSGVRQVLRAALPDYIIHFGAISPVSYSFDHPQEVLQSNLLGTINLAEGARAELPNFRGFLYASSMEVYGDLEEDVYTEEMTPRPNCPYAVFKLAAEKYLEYMARTYKFPCVSFRQTNTYGRKDNDYFIVETIITQMIKNKKSISLGRKEPVRNFIHIDDLVNLYSTVLREQWDGEQWDGIAELVGGTYNTGPVNGLTIEALANKIAFKLKWKGRISWNTREIRAGEVFRLNSSCEAIMSKVSWYPEITLDEGLDMTIAYWKKKLSKSFWE